MLVRVLLPDAEQVPLGEDADARLLIGDAALKSMFEDDTLRPRPALARAHGPADGLRRLRLPRSGPRTHRRARAGFSRGAPAQPCGAGAPRPRASARYGYPPGFLALLREAPLPLRSPRARRPALLLRARRQAGELERVPGSASSSRSRSKHDPADVLDKALSGERITDDDALDASAQPRPSWPSAAPPTSFATASSTGARHLHHRPERQLHERLLHGLRLLRLLPPAGRYARGLPPPEGGHLQEDRGDARAGRHRPPHAGRPPSGSRRRLLRGSLQLDQGALPGPPARALPSEIQHAARRSKFTIPQALAPSRRRSRLASGGGAEILVDRVRNIISPKKTTTAGVARDHARGPAHRHVDDGDDDVRPRRDARAGRAHAPDPRAAGRDARVPRLHLLDVPARRQPALRAGA